MQSAFPDSFTWTRIGGEVRPAARRAARPPHGCLV